MTVLWSRVMTTVDRLQARPAAAYASVFLWSLFILALPSVLSGLPAPAVHDEFSYLLAGDTFAHFRLTNPGPPCWQAFETMHVLVHPTYASKYPPAQGLFLALGVLLGYPIIGVWISGALACLAVYWLLLSTLPRRWALYGACLLPLHPTLLRWSHSYWGGAAAMLGGALLFGGLLRLLHALYEVTRTGPRRQDAVWMAVGMAILANSRPYEGLILSLAAVFSLMPAIARARGLTTSDLTRQIVVPILLVLGAAASWMGFYNWRVTGQALQMPYAEHSRQYQVIPYFHWQQPRPEPVYSDPALRDYYVGWEGAKFQAERTKSGWFRELTTERFPTYLNASLRLFEPSVPGWLEPWQPRLTVLWQYLPIVPLLWLPAAIRRDRRLRPVALGAAAVLIALAANTGEAPHYAAPAVAAFALLALAALRESLQRLPEALRRGVMVSVFGLFAASAIVILPQLKTADFAPWTGMRQTICQTLEHAGGQHLVLVRYGPRHSVQEEWVYNGADLAGARVIWARDRGPAADALLLQQFPNRRAWLLYRDGPVTHFSPYQPGP